MKIALTIKILLISITIGFAQNVSKEELDNVLKPITSKVKQLESENVKLKKEVIGLKVNLSSTILQLDSIERETRLNSNAISQSNQTLGQKISTTAKEANAQILQFNESLSTKTLYGIIAVLVTTLLSIFLYWLLNKKQKTDKTDLISKLGETRSSIEESLVKEFGKQTELMETQLRIIEEHKLTKQTITEKEMDHSLALKVADEITLIERNVRLMDAKTKGLKQLVASIGKLKDNLIANGYELPELLGKDFHQGMKVIVTSSIPDENLEKGAEIITKIIKPQVNFNDKMIQTAQIEVSVGY
jgi:hypothetical protein